MESTSGAGCCPACSLLLPQARRASSHWAAGVAQSCSCRASCCSGVPRIRRAAASLGAWGAPCRRLCRGRVARSRPASTASLTAPGPDQVGTGVSIRAWTAKRTGERQTTQIPANRCPNKHKSRLPPTPARMSQNRRATSADNSPATVSTPPPYGYKACGARGEVEESKLAHGFLRTQSVLLNA